MNDPEMLRPKDAAARFRVARTTLIAWAADGLIGRSKIGGMVFYPAQDIADVIALHLKPRTIVPVVTQQSPIAVDDGWRDSPLWAGTVASRGGSR